MRLIDAEKAVEELSVAYWDKGIQAAKDDPCIVDAMTDWAIRTIKAMPTMGDWIACSERLPEEDGYYLVTLEFDYGKEIEMGWLLDGEWINENSHVTVAWMPLPEVWKDDGE